MFKILFEEDCIAFSNACYQVPAARLLLQLKELLSLTQLVSLLLVEDFDLRQSVLERLFSLAYGYRSKMIDIANAAESIGTLRCLENVLPLVEGSGELSPEVCERNPRHWLDLIDDNSLDSRFNFG